MSPRIASFTLVLAACGGSSSSLTSPSTDGGGADVVAEGAPASDAGSDALADSGQPSDGSTLADTGTSAKDAGTDTGTVVEAEAGALCCLNAMTTQGGQDVNCGPSAWAPCTNVAYNSASCAGVGSACTAWPNQYGGPGSPGNGTCGAPFVCCTGVVGVCGTGM
jgi:hypothetical protein